MEDWYQYYNALISINRWEFLNSKYTWNYNPNSSILRIKSLDNIIWFIHLGRNQRNQAIFAFCKYLNKLQTKNQMKSNVFVNLIELKSKGIENSKGWEIGKKREREKQCEKEREKRERERERERDNIFLDVLPNRSILFCQIWISI